jgi:DDE superfamily endonuclease/Helix-turn-helix of DDE superfamily endonuclease
MIGRSATLSRYPAVFLQMTGLRVGEFDDLLTDILPHFMQAEQARLRRTDRQRASGGGRSADLAARDQVLLTVVWLRQYPTNEVLGFLFGISDSTASRVRMRILPLLEALGRDTMRMPDPGKKRRKTLDGLLAETPPLAVIIDTFEQRVQRPRDHQAQRAHYSGKKKQHTLKVQVAIDEDTGAVCDVSDSHPGPTADMTILKDSALLDRLPDGVGGIGDLGYQGIAALHPQGLGACPRRKPRRKERPPADGAFNRAFSQRRIRVEHTIGRIRRYQCLSQLDRHHRQHHSMRTRAVAGLVNRQIQSRRPY